MVKALVISYNALPMDVVSSYRTKGYCDHLSSFGIRPTLITHRWERDENTFTCHSSGDGIRVEESENCTVIRLPYPGTRPSGSSLKTLCHYLTGHLDVEFLDSYKAFKHFLWNHLKQNRYHVVIAIYNPHFHLRLAYECLREFGIPYVLDFRDLWNNELITPSYNPNFRQAAIDYLIRFWWKKWIRRSLFFVTTGKKWQEFLSKMSGHKGIVSRNGFDYLSEQEYQSPLRQRTFKIIHFGRLYESQVLDIFLSGFMSFARNFSFHEVRLEIVGLKKVRDMDFQAMIQNRAEQYVTFLPYMSKQELNLYCQKEAALFFFPNFKEENGQFPVKLYDYIMIGRNIIVSPAGGEISEFVRATDAGVVLDRSQEVTDYLHQAFKVFKENGLVPCTPDRSKLAQFTRRNQVKVMANEILSVLHRDA